MSDTINSYLSLLKKKDNTNYNDTVLTISNKLVTKIANELLN